MHNASIYLLCRNAWELAGNCRRYHCIYMITCVVPRILNHIQYVHHKRFIYNCTKWTLIDTCTTRNTFVVVDYCFSIFVYFHCTHRASTDTRALYFTNCIEWTNLFTTSTFYTQFLVDIGTMVDNGNRISWAYFLTFMSQTATTCFCNYKTVDRAFITCRIQYIDDTIVFGWLHHQSYTVFNDMTFFINTTTE